jgi:uncharacterized protein (TIGR02145 family)
MDLFSPAGILTDVDGNVYNTVKIGTQIWMAENLKTTKYSDGTTIPIVTANTLWSSLSTPYYCWYGLNEASYKASYGALYNWYTVNKGNLCPTGWHVPSDTEWTTLITYLGGPSVAGGKLKETETNHWQSPNAEATNKSGFSALPGGGFFRILHPDSYFFGYIGRNGYWWSCTEYLSGDAYYWSIGYDISIVNRAAIFESDFFSVRCVRD